MQILIIAGGDGSRMQPLVTPKSLFPFLGQSMLEHLLKNLQPFSASSISLVTNPLAFTAVESLAKKHHLKVVVQSQPLGMADAILSAETVLDPQDETLVIDSVTVQEPAVYSHFAAAIQADPASILLGGRKVEHYKHGGYFVFDKQQKIVKIVEKPGEDKMPSPYLKLVLDYYPKTSELLRYMAAAQSAHDDLYEVGLSEMIGVYGAKMVEVKGHHASLKHAPRVLDVMETFLENYLTPGIDPTATIAKTAVIDGVVQIARGVRVFDHATVKGPCYIGENTVVGNGALIRSSCIEADCEIGYNTEIARSYIGPQTKCHTSYVGDSIIEGSTNLAAGTITANLRFDNRNVLVDLPSGKIDSGRRKFGAILARGVKTGIHASLMPGTVAAANTIIGTEGIHDKTAA